MNDELKVIGNFIKSVKGWAMAYGMTTIDHDATKALDTFNRLEASLTNKKLILSVWDEFAIKNSYNPDADFRSWVEENL